MSDTDATEQEDYDCTSCDRCFDTYNGLCVHHSKTHGERLSPEVECENCGGMFEVSRCRKNEAKFCSMECSRVRETIECKQCGSDFEVLPSRSDREFCSKECSYSWHTGENHHNRKEPVVETCDTCGVDFERPQWKAEKAERSFCSEECRAEWVGEFMTGRFTGEDHWLGGADPEEHPMYAGGTFPYGPGFEDDKKEAVRERDGRECQHCGRSEERHIEEYGMKHHVHHIKKARSFDDPEKRNAMDNLVTLCIGECHSAWEKLSPLQPAIVSAD